MANPEVDWFFEKKGVWQEAYSILRELALETGLKEELKWGCPCYTLNTGNVFLIHGFKDYCAILIMQGALLKDDHKWLVQQTKNVQAARQLRFSSAEEILAKRSEIMGYLTEAIENEKAGKKLELKKTAEFEMPEEFANALEEMSDLKEAFYKLTPGRQRGYLLHFSSAKQAKTRLDRVEKNIPKILAGKGMEDS